MRRLLGLGSLIVALGSVSGCVVAVREQRPPPPRAYCGEWVWIGGHYGPRGQWHPGHWRCA